MEISAMFAKVVSVGMPVLVSFYGDESSQKRVRGAVRCQAFDAALVGCVTQVLRTTLY